jgi:hypothetical protein
VFVTDIELSPAFRFSDADPVRGLVARPGKAVLFDEGLAENRKSLEELTKEDYQKALGEIQGALAGCVGNLIILGGYLDSDDSLDSENTHYVLMAAKDIVHVASQAVKKALSHTYPMV